MDSFSFAIEPGHIVMFARAIGDTNPDYAAVCGSGPQSSTVDAPLTFVQCAAHFDPDYHLRPVLGRAWFGSGRDDTGDEARARARLGSMHAEQHFVYHRPVRAGERLTAIRRVGDSWQKRSRRGDTLHFSEVITDFVLDDGTTAVTARSVTVLVEAPGSSE
jgi:hypothetical protein